MTLGGSPMAVAVPPMLENITSAIRTYFGSSSSTSHSLQVRGQKYKRETRGQDGEEVLKYQNLARDLLKLKHLKVYVFLVVVVGVG